MGLSATEPTCPKCTSMVPKCTSHLHIFILCLPLPYMSCMFCISITQEANPKHVLNGNLRQIHTVEYSILLYFRSCIFPFSKSQVSQQRLAANQMGRGDVSMPPFSLESESQNSKLCFCSSGVNEIGVIVSPFPTKKSNRATHRNRIWFDDVLYCPVNWKKWDWVLNIFIFSHYRHPLESQFFWK